MEKPQAGERYCKVTSWSNETEVSIVRITDKCVFFNVNGGNHNRRLPKEQVKRLIEKGKWVKF